ncbi:MAG: AAA family ATPase [Spirochaetota bacterium]
MKRKIEQNLLAWKDSSRRKPLILRGARQVGKTWIVRKFGKGHFESFVEIDFEKNPDIHSAFSGSLDTGKILTTLEFLTGQRIVAGKTLLFFDEIQACPRAILALRYFYEEIPGLAIISAGSLLEFALADISFPVGRIQFLNMHPMTFFEFLQACNKQMILKILQEKPQELAEPIHEKILEELRMFFLVGGMPESVETYVKEKNMLQVSEVHKELLFSFREDFSKYAPYADKLCFEDVFRNSAVKLGSQIKYSHLSSSFKSPTIKKALDTLVKARVLTKVNAISSFTPPLNSQLNLKKFKVLLLDLGLWQNLSGMHPYQGLLNENLSHIYRGALAEQYVGQELLSVLGELKYWARDKPSSSAEVDFICESRGINIPIEVKSGASGSLKSMHLALHTYPDIPFGYVLSSRPYHILKEQKLVFLPLYYVGNIMNYQITDFL